MGDWRRTSDRIGRRKDLLNGSETLLTQESESWSIILLKREREKK